MRTLVDNLVLLAKLEGDVVRPVEPFDVVALAEEIVAVRRGLNPDVAITIDARIDGTVVADRGEIHEALANIVDNAIKYAPDSPIAISLDSPRAGAIAISVCDQGPGIPPEDRASIFERFYRGASRGEVEGSGLGLAIAKRALERAGGTLVLEPTVERGTCFVLTMRAERLERRPTLV
jgi:signal transduction histidine kinase